MSAAAVPARAKPPAPAVSDADSIVGKHGYMALVALLRNDRTEVDALARRIPYQYQGAHYQDHDDEPFVLLHNSAGGYVEGDVGELHVELRPGARALLTTMGATKFYKSVHGDLAEELIDVHVGAGALLEFLPDEVIPYATSRVRRVTRVTADADAALFVTDLLSAGRVHYGAGEAFAFGALDSTLELRVGGRLLYLERLRVADDEVRALERLWAGRLHAATVLAYGHDLPPDVEAEAEADASAVDGVLAGASRRGRLVCVRVLAHETWALHEAVLQVWNALRPALAGKRARAIRKC